MILNNLFLNICLLMYLCLYLISMFMLILSLYFLKFNFVYFIEYNFITMDSSMISMTILLDWMSMMFMGVVMFISSLVILYSKSYMMNDLFMNRFIYLILLFVLSMLLLIISPNLISILLGWDGLGLVSYCLVIYYQNIKSFNSGMLTVLSNRVGDVFLLMSIAWMFNFGSWNYLFYLDFFKNSFEMKIIMMMIFISSMTKSAQIPFSSWLPAAMAAPTPVSSLVHSSTLVTAGVYLLIRFSNLFSVNFLKFILLISGLTMFMSGLAANFEYDLKKIIALSTLSQLGLMIMTLGMGLNLMTYFHMLTHAMFKALLFMCAGLMIHNLKNIQDIRFMGSLSKQLPLTMVFFNFSNLSLCGFPFLAGFYSKDLILEMYLMSNMNLVIFFFFFFSSFLTVSYTFRLIFFLTLSEFNLSSLNFLFKEDYLMIFSMLNLFIMTVLGGSCLIWLMFNIPSLIFLPKILKILPLLLIFLGSLFGYYMFITNFSLINLKFYMLKSFFSLMWFLPILFTFGMVKYPLILSKFYFLKNDLSWNEYFGGQGIFLNLKNYSKFGEWLSYNKFMTYLFMFLMLYILLFYMMIFM
uniref:NADH-ubiquinone oxidoreductase chain 5 n=1 Tax=Arge aurora TaxID=2728854 RepID=A0A6M5U4Z9_9HYME|nr:NADH dehydrogenase subunit 5 [Arge aurora]